jgi:hypothetical protein
MPLGCVVLNPRSPISCAWHPTFEQSGCGYRHAMEHLPSETEANEPYKDPIVDPTEQPRFDVSDPDELPPEDEPIDPDAPARGVLFPDEDAPEPNEPA